MLRKTGVRIHVGTMSRALALIQARRGKPRPRVKCPWHPAAKTRRLNKIARLLASLPRHEVAVYEDEVDVHLNPKIGLDWMGLGQQKDVMTPGQNEKRYLAGALDVRTGQLHWVEGEKKDAWLFMDLLKKLTLVYASWGYSMPLRPAAISLSLIYLVGIGVLAWAPETRNQPLPE
jgi:hypothetical protein